MQSNYQNTERKQKGCFLARPPPRHCSEFDRGLLCQVRARHGTKLSKSAGPSPCRERYTSIDQSGWIDQAGAAGGSVGRNGLTVDAADV